MHGKSEYLWNVHSTKMFPKPGLQFSKIPVKLHWVRRNIQQSYFIHLTGWKISFTIEPKLAKEIMTQFRYELYRCF